MNIEADSANKLISDKLLVIPVMNPTEEKAETLSNKVSSNSMPGSASEKTTAVVHTPKKGITKLNSDHCTYR